MIIGVTVSVSIGSNVLPDCLLRLNKSSPTDRHVTKSKPREKVFCTDAYTVCRAQDRLLAERIVGMSRKWSCNKPALA